MGQPCSNHLNIFFNSRFINPSENLMVSILALGEGWHNYHHTFPWDYKTSELGKYSVNFSTCLIDMMAKIGWTYDLKSVSEEMIKKRVLRTGDGTHEVWGWGDKDQPKEDQQEAVITHRKLKWFTSNMFYRELYIIFVMWFRLFYM